LEVLRDNAKADLVAASLGEAVKLCIEATELEDQRHPASKQEMVPLPLRETSGMTRRK
jgi:hypothetical protein